MRRVILISILTLLIILISSGLANGISCNPAPDWWAAEVFVDRYIAKPLTVFPSYRSNNIIIDNLGSVGTPLAPVCNYEGQVRLAISVNEVQEGIDCTSPNKWYPWEDITPGNPTSYSEIQDIEGFIIEWDSSPAHCLCAEKYKTGSGRVSKGLWEIGGDIGRCCEDDIDEHQIIETAGNDVAATFGYNDGTDACCDLSSDCVENNQCYANGTIIPEGTTYVVCEDAVWYGGDAGESKCSTLDCNWLNETTWAGVTQPAYCCGDDANENFKIKMTEEPIVLPDGTISPTQDIYSCCPREDDCAYGFRCYQKGEVIDVNPRYTCGENNELIESLDIDYRETKVKVEEATQIGREHPTQSSAEYLNINSNPMNNLISCNNDINIAQTIPLLAGGNNPYNDFYLPQIWLPVSTCSQGSLRIRIVNNVGGTPIQAETKVILYLYNLGVAGNAPYDNDRKYREITVTPDSEGYVQIDNILGTYYTVVYTTDIGYIGVETNVRVDYDGITEITIPSYKTNGCIGCMNFGNGYCDSSCAGKELSDVKCEFPNDFALAACDKKYPGTQSVGEDGMIYNCCPADGVSWTIGKYVPRQEAVIDCSSDNLVTKNYVVEWNNEPITVVVTVCGD